MDEAKLEDSPKSLLGDLLDIAEVGIPLFQGPNPSVK